MIAPLLAELSSLGITLTVVDGRLHARPKRRITPGIRALIAAHRDEIVAALAEPVPLRPLDDDIAAHAATMHAGPAIDRRIERLEGEAALPNPDRLAIIALADWRQIRGVKES